MAIVFSLLSMGFAGFNDLLFKKYGAKDRPTGIFISIIGLIWALFFIISGLSKGSLVFSETAVLIGLLSGVCSALANIIFIVAMKKTGAAVGATIYRLNLIIVAILAFVFLGESLSPLKIAGLLCAVITVLLFCVKSSGNSHAPAGYIVLALVTASFFRAGMGFSYKLAAIYSTSTEAFLVINGLCWVAAGIIYAFYKNESFIPPRKVLYYGSVSGFLVCGIALFLRLATGRGDASVVVTISKLSFLITFPLSVIFLKEHFSLPKFVAIGLALVCIILFSFSK